MVHSMVDAHQILPAIIAAISVEVVNMVVSIGCAEDQAMHENGFSVSAPSLRVAHVGTPAVSRYKVDVAIRNPKSPRLRLVLMECLYEPRCPIMNNSTWHKSKSWFSKGYAATILPIMGLAKSLRQNISVTVRNRTGGSHGWMLAWQNSGGK